MAAVNKQESMQPTILSTVVPSQFLNHPTTDDHHAVFYAPSCPVDRIHQHSFVSNDPFFGTKMDESICDCLVSTKEEKRWWTCRTRILTCIERWTGIFPCFFTHQYIPLIWISIPLCLHNKVPVRRPVLCKLLAKENERAGLAARFDIPELIYFAANVTVTRRDPGN